MTGKLGPGSDVAGLRASRFRLAVPILLAGLILVYEFVWRERLGQSAPWVERVIHLALFLLVGPVMAWWGQSMSRGLLQRLARSEAASEEKTRLLEQRNRQLQTVLQASRAMTSVLDLKQVAGLVVEQVVAYTRFTKASLVLGPDENGNYVLAGSYGLPDEHLRCFVEALTGPQKASSPVEWCRLTRQPVVVENLGKDFRTAGLGDVFATAGLEGMIAVPLLLHEHFRGTLTVYLDKGGPISTAEISLVSALASQSALALENARLYTLTSQNRNRIDKALEFLENVASALTRTRVGVSPLLHLVAQVTARLFAPACIRMVITRAGRHPPTVVVEVADLHPEAEGRFRSALSTPEAVVEPPGPCTLTLPVTLDADHFGEFEVYLVGEGRRLDAEEVRILRAFVHLTASALGSAALVAEMRQGVEAVEGAYMGTLEALTKALEMRDHETQGHSRRVVQYTLSLAQKLGVPESQLVPLIRGALLHDIGKIGIPDAILKKQGPLTTEEWAIMKQHPQIGHDMLKGIEFLRLATPIILHHHERFDGTGYPQGLSGHAIPLGARIFAVADAYDAITSDRPYRKGRDHAYAIAEISAGAGKQFDPSVVEALQSLPSEELLAIRERHLELAR